MEPAVETMLFNIPGNTSTTIDLSQSACLLNRRFYRQGLNWAVAGFTFITQPGKTGTISVAKVPNTWVARNAWVKGFHAWNDMNDKALEENESLKPKYNDFKIFMDDVHHLAGTGANALPMMGNPATSLTPGEWDISSYRIPVGIAAPGDTTDREIVWTGANYPGAGASGLDAVSLIEGYAAGRALPDIMDPNTPGDADLATGTTPQNWAAAIFSEGTEQDSAVISDLQTENDIAPYPFENAAGFADTMYPGGANQPGGVVGGLTIHDQVGISATSIGNTTRMKGTNFYGGLIRIEGGMNDASAIGVLVHLVPGVHRGYLAEPMQDV
jgi:hypothetical protein